MSDLMMQKCKNAKHCECIYRVHANKHNKYALLNINFFF